MERLLQSVSYGVWLGRPEFATDGTIGMCSGILLNENAHETVSIRKRTELK